MLTDWILKRSERRMGDADEAAVRCALGKTAGWAGVAANIFLFAAKLLAGVLSASVSIIADAFNNLSDAGSSLVTLIGFRLSAAPPDKEHPFGHGRMEYLSTLGVAALILVAGFEVLTSAVKKIISPQVPRLEWVSIVVLTVAIAVKLWMMLFYRKVDRRIHSQTLAAAAADSRNDILCTAIVLVSTLFGGFTGVALDGYVGVAVALFVLWSGFSIMKETVSPLLGQAPDPEFVRTVREKVLSYDGVIGVHDLMVHNYGPGRLMLSLHAEVPSNVDMMKSHDLIDLVERDLMETFHAVTCIHMDPVVTDDERVDHLRMLTTTVAEDVDASLSLHDFRVVFGETHTNVIFDLVVPFNYRDHDKAVAEIERRLRVADPHLNVVATVEHEYG